jgi:predicted transcriptional regulator
VTDDTAWKGKKQRAEKTRVVTFRSPTRLIDKVDAIVANNDTDRTAIINHQLEQFVKENDAAPKSGLFE